MGNSLVLRPASMASGPAIASIRLNHSDCANPDLMERNNLMVDRIARCDPGLVRQAARRAPGCGDAVSYVPSDLHRARPQEPESSPRPIFLVADRLVQIWSSNEREFAELRALRLKVAQTRAYLASPGCNRLLGHACLERLETLHRKHLARLRANRRAAWKLMAELGAELPPPAEPQPQSLWISGRARDLRIPDSRRHCTQCWYA